MLTTLLPPVLPSSCSCSLAPHQRLRVTLTLTPPSPSSLDPDRPEAEEAPAVVPSTRGCCGCWDWGGCLGTARPKRKWKGERLEEEDWEAGDRGEGMAEGAAAAAAVSAELWRRISLMP